MDSCVKSILFWGFVVAMVFGILSGIQCRINVRSEPVEPNQVVFVPGVGQWNIVEHRGMQTLVDPNGEVVGLIRKEYE